MRIKIGDRVKVKRSNEIGVVVDHVNRSVAPIIVEFDNNDYGEYDEKELEFCSFSSLLFVSPILH